MTRSDGHFAFSALIRRLVTTWDGEKPRIGASVGRIRSVVNMGFDDLRPVYTRIRGWAAISALAI